MLKKSHLIISCLILVIVVIWLGSQSYKCKNTNSQITKTIQTKKELVKVGVIAPLSGLRAEGGEFIHNALEIALEEINSNDDNQFEIELIYEDSKYEATTAVTATKKLLEIDKVNYIIGAQGSSVTLAIAPVVEEAGKILITPGSQSDKISNIGENIFRVIHNTTQEPPFAAKFISEEMSSDTIHFLGLNSDATPSYLKYFEPELSKYDKKLGVIEKYDPKTNDFRTHLLKIKEKNPTDIFLLATPKHSGLILTQAKDLEIEAQFYTISVEGPELINIAGDLAEGILYSYSYDSQSNEKNVKTFATRYLEKYGQVNDTVAANSYDALQLISKCLGEKGDDVKEVKACLYNTKDYSGASGTFSINEKGDAIKQFIIKTIKDGKFVKYK